MFLERSRQDEFKPVSFTHIVGAVPEFQGGIFNFGTTRARKVVAVSLERSRRDEFKAVSFIHLAWLGSEFCRCKGLAEMSQTRIDHTHCRGGSGDWGSL